jgi:alkylation response protein AidB-like acyl-CoA dehydrogenase
MEFRYTDEQQRFRQELRDWLEEHLPEGWSEGERNASADELERKEFLKSWQRKLSDGGWAGIHWPEKYGGRGASLIEQSIFQEEMARYDAPMRINAIGLDFVGPTLIEAGTPEQKQRFLSEILTGEEIWCQGYSEPNAGSDVASLTTQAERNGDDFIINGQKVWTSLAHWSDWCFLTVRTDDSGSKHEGLTVILVDMNQDGVTTKPIHQISDEKTFNEVFFDDAVAPVDNVVGKIDEGWGVMKILSSYEHARTFIYDIERRFEEILAYCKTEHREGKLLTEHSHVRQKLAEFKSRILAAKTTHYRHITAQQNREYPGPEGSIDHVISDELAVELENFAQNITGQEAMLWEDDSHGGRWSEQYLKTYGHWIAGGTADINRNIIAENLLDLPEDIKDDTSHRG